MKIRVCTSLEAVLVPEMETVPPHIQIHILSEYHSSAVAWRAVEFSFILGANSRVWVSVTHVENHSQC